MLNDEYMRYISSFISFCFFVVLSNFFRLFFRCFIFFLWFITFYLLTKTKIFQKFFRKQNEQSFTNIKTFPSNYLEKNWHFTWKTYFLPGNFRTLIFYLCPFYGQIFMFFKILTFWKKNKFFVLKIEPKNEKIRILWNNLEQSEMF